MKKEKKLDSKTYLNLIIILFVVIILLVGKICYDKGIHAAKNENLYYENKYKEEEIKDIDVLNDLSTHIDVLLGLNIKTNTYIKNNLYRDKIFNYNVIDNKITNEDKQLMIYNGVEWKKKEDKLTITEEVYNKKSIDLFGEIIKPLNELEKHNKYKYVEEEHLHYKEEGNSLSEGNNFVMSYKRKFTRIYDRAEVIVTLAYLEKTDNSYKIYKDRNHTNLIKESLEMETINEDNYKEFDSYIFNFNRASNGNYYIESITKVE